MFYMRPEKAWDAQDAYMTSLQVLQDRIFIWDDMQKIKVYDRWTGAVKTMLETGEYNDFELTSEALRKDIIRAARRPL